MGPQVWIEERSALERYRKRVQEHGAKEGDGGEALFDTQNSGREMYELWGYLRWRTVYTDRYADHRHQFPQLAKAGHDLLAARKADLEAQVRDLSGRMRGLEQRKIGRDPRYPYLVDELTELQAMKTRAEIELEAVETFLAELGPAPWW